MFAKELARRLDMNYVIISGCNLKEKNWDVVDELEVLGDWMRYKSKKFVLFIEHADVFLSKQSAKNNSSELITFFKLFIERNRKHIKVLLSSETKNSFDIEIEKLKIEEINFSMPNIEERERLLHLYFQMLVGQPAMIGKDTSFQLEHFDYKAVCRDMAARSDQFSFKDITNLFEAWQKEMTATSDQVVTKQMILDCFRRYQEEVTFFSAFYLICTSKL